MSPDDPGSVTRWINDLKGGELDAAQPLWERYFADLVRLARARLGVTPRTAADEEDVALSAFDSFCAGVARGRFPRLDDRNDLWRVLVALTGRKAADQALRERRQKRGGGRVRSEADLAGGEPEGDANLFGQVAGPEPTPEFAAEMVEAVEGLFNLLDDEELRRIALRKLEGYSNEEIAAKIGRSLPTVERRLKMIRDIWKTDRANE